MAESTPNDQLAANVGQDKPVKEAIENYDSAHGRYAPPVEPLAPPAPRTGAGVAAPSPFGTLKKGG